MTKFRGSVLLFGIAVLFASGCAMVSYNYVEPTSPKVTGHPYDYPDVVSLQPTLCWKPVHGALKRHSATYELEIYKAVEWKWGFMWAIKHMDMKSLGDPVYRRAGISGTSHKVDTPLEPATRYMWRVRGHWVENGQSRTTKGWSSYNSATLGKHGFKSGLGQGQQHHNCWFTFKTP